MTAPGAIGLAAYRARYRGGDRPSTVAEDLLAAIAAHDDPAVWIDGPCAARLRVQAEALDRRDPASLPLYGIPFAVKDNIDVAGLPTTAACPAFAYRPDRSAAVVAALEAAGAMLVGKTNLDQFATGLVGTRSPYGVPRNVLVAERIPGGSSSGSAVAVAAGLAAFALGTDTAGSGRVPAMMNGIVGLKPTRGLVSTRGVVPACRTLDCVSIFAGSVEDSLEVLAVAAADLVEIDLAPFLEAAALLYDGPWVAERTAVIEALLAAEPEAIHPVVREIVARGRTHTAIGTFRAQYRLAALRRAAEAALDGLDALLLPTAPFVPSLAEVEAEPVLVNTRLGTYTNFVNLLDLAALAIPAGMDAEGLPFGVTLIGPAFAEAKLAAVADAIAGAPPRSLGPAAWPDLEIVLFGAHMRGLPLNAELARLGGRFAAEVRTAPLYRMVALPGTPARPGVIPTAAGARLAGEAWLVPAASVAALLAAIPAPLALGRLRLEDGREAVGFVCTEAEPPAAEDITRFGGWRAYLASREGVPAI